MNLERQNTARGRFAQGSQRWRRVVAVVASLWLVAACGRGDAEPTATATSTSLPTVAATAEPMTPTAAMAATATATVAAASPSSPMPGGTAAVFVPLEVEESADCEIESHLDLAGYPNLEEKMGCPLDEATFDPVALNEFGEGPDYDRFMLWFSDEQRIYVLLPDSAWQVFDDTWTEDEPTFACNPLGGEPESPPLPRRGFGKLWCSQPQLQAALGVIPREERLCQHTVVQRFELGRLLACFEDATVRYFRILDNGRWDINVQ